MKRKVMLTTLKLNDMGVFTARARLRTYDDNGIMRGGDLLLQATISDELHAQIRHQVEDAIARAVGDDVEPTCDGHWPVPSDDDDDLPF